WITSNLASKILSYKVQEQMAIISDHKQVTIILDWFKYKPNRICFNTNIYQFKDATPENIKGFKEDIELACLTSNTST
ncbi:15453_t:CDS:1, partial [Acaulospora colombiana]